MLSGISSSALEYSDYSIFLCVHFNSLANCNFPFSPSIQKRHIRLVFHLAGSWQFSTSLNETQIIPAVCAILNKWNQETLLRVWDSGKIHVE